MTYSEDKLHCGCNIYCTTQWHKRKESVTYHICTFIALHYWHSRNLTWAPEFSNDSLCVVESATNQSSSRDDFPDCWSDTRLEVSVDQFDVEVVHCRMATKGLQDDLVQGQALACHSHREQQCDFTVDFSCNIQDLVKASGANRKSTI